MLDNTSAPVEAMALQTKRWNSDQSRRAAVRRRDDRADGCFVYAVRTTGVYCRPSCPSRRARPENLVFFASAQSAERAGFRACRRCTPEIEAAERPLPRRIAQLCRLIERAATPPTLNELASHARLSPFHLQRTFKRITGLSPHAYALAVRARRARAALSNGATVTDAIFASGFESGSRFYATSNARLGMTPTRFRRGGEDIAIRYAFARSSLGEVLVACTAKGICAIYIGDARQTLLEELRERFPRAQLRSAGKDFAATVRSVVAALEEPALAESLPLDIRGTAFQERVWNELRRIPAGVTASYGEIAARIGAAGASRAVARACAANELAVIIPCHRVVRGTGAVSGYRWGPERKRTLLAREKAGAELARERKARAPR